LIAVDNYNNFFNGSATLLVVVRFCARENIFLNWQNFTCVYLRLICVQFILEFRCSQSAVYLNWSDAKIQICV